MIKPWTFIRLRKQKYMYKLVNKLCNILFPVSANQKQPGRMYRKNVHNTATLYEW